MATRQRNDLHMNIPALRKLDNMLLDCLDNFKEPHEFYYGSKDDDKGEKAQRSDDKWWIPVPKVPTNGLSENNRKWLQYQKDSVNQVLKAAMAINAQVLNEMEIPDSYIDALPKNGRASLGDAIYKTITEDIFDPDCLLSSLDLSSEHKIVDLKNKIEASVVIWKRKRKMNAKDTKSPWGSAVSIEKREILEDRAETVLLILKHRFPGIPQSDLDISKIETNKDLGHAVLESYSRILETLAFTVLSRIEDVMSADAQARGSATAEKTRSIKVSEKVAGAKEETESETPNSKTLQEFMGWNGEQQQGETDGKKANDANADAKTLTKQENLTPSKKLSYLERLEVLGGSRSPTARH